VSSDLSSSDEDDENVDKELRKAQKKFAEKESRKRPRLKSK
jgi:hypothetical protein